MKKILSVVLVTLLILSILPSAMMAATDVGPGQVTNVSPADYAKNVDRNAVLEATIKDPNGAALKTVEFKEGFEYDFASDNGISGFQGLYNNDPLSASPVGGNAFSSGDKQNAAYLDQNYVVTDGQDNFPYHRFEVDVTKQLLSGNKIELFWQGKTKGNGKLILSAWDYTSGKWVALQEKTGNTDGSNITFSAPITEAKYFQNGKLQAMVHDASPAPAPTPGTGGSNEKFKLLWFTDTQFYAMDRPEVWKSMTDYMINEYTNGQIEYVINTGDLVHYSTSQKQWDVANENLNRMDAAGIPYGVLAGNRDIVDQNTGELFYDNYYKYAGASRFAGKPWYGESMDNNRNHYDLMSFNGHEFIILYLSHQTAQDAETVQWANEMFAKHSDKNGILAMHEYYDPGNFGTGIAEDIFARIVTPSENVKMVLSGHYTGSRHREKKVTNSDGTVRTVVEVLSNYQNREGAEGYLKLMTFDPATNTVDFDTYSPFYNDFNYFEDANEDFTRTYELASAAPVDTPAIRQVSTDYISISVYSDKSIDIVNNLTSGGKATVRWENLDSNTEYFWYMNITNTANETRTSKIYRFTTNDAALPEPEEPAEPTFPDVVGTPYAWALEYIEAMAAAGIITGHEDGTFKPGNSIERQHVALMFTRAMELEAVVPEKPFDDVPEYLRYYEEIMATQKAGIFEGFNNKFYPAGKMTRAEMAKVLVVAFDIQAEGDHPFTDVPDSHWASEYIGPLYAAGITEGDGNNRYNLEQEVTRAEFATFMYRALEYKENNQ